MLRDHGGAIPRGGKRGDFVEALRLLRVALGPPVVSTGHSEDSVHAGAIGLV